MQTLFKQRLQQQRHQQLWRDRVCLQSPQSAWVTVEGKRHLSFTSSNYLGLANDERVIHAFQQGAARYGVGSGASQQLTGYCQAHAELEAALAAFTKRSCAVLFNSGYHANLGVINALVSRNDTVFHDKLNHVSLIDAVRLTNATHYRYRHCDLAHVTKLANQKQISGKPFFFSESVFSMDGQLAPLAELATLANTHHGLLYVDDAHGFGVLGEQGAGTLMHLGLTEQQTPLMMGTLGKACGVSGAFVAGDSVLIDTILQFAHTLRYSIALPPAIACAALASIQIMQQEPWRYQTLHHLIAYFNRLATQAQLPLIPSTTPIQSIMLGNNQSALDVAADLAARGIIALAIRPPTVPAHSARIRINITAAHTTQDIDLLITALTESLANVDVSTAC